MTTSARSPRRARRCSCEQAKKAGVDVKVVKKNPFYGNDYLSYPFGQDFWNTRNYLPQAAVGCDEGRHLQRDALGQVAVVPEVRRAGHAAAAEVDETKRNDLLKQAQVIEYNEGGYIIWGFRTQVDGLTSKVSGPQGQQVPATG